MGYRQNHISTSDFLSLKWGGVTNRFKINLLYNVTTRILRESRVAFFVLPLSMDKIHNLFTDN